MYQTDWAAFLKEVDARYPFFDLKGIRGDWEKTKARLSRKVKSCASPTAFLGMVVEAIRCLRDAHMSVIRAKVQMPEWSNRYYPGLSFMPATQNRVIVMWAATKYADKLKPGTVVTKIDGREARAVLEEDGKAAWCCKNPYFVSSPQRARFLAYRIPLLGTRNQAHALRFLANGKQRELRVVCDVAARGWPHTYNRPANLTQANRTLSYAKLPSGAGYMYLRCVQRSETTAAMGQALKAHPDAKGWIIDLRGNGGGGYDQKLVEQVKVIPRPVVVLIDAGCMSAGETLARDLAKLAKARLLGSRTAGASREKRTWTFPSGIASITFSTRSHWRNDGQPIEYSGIEPDVELEPVPEEVARGFNSEILRVEEYLAQHRFRDKKARLRSGSGRKAGLSDFRSARPLGGRP